MLLLEPPPITRATPRRPSALGHAAVLLIAAFCLAGCKEGSELSVPHPYRVTVERIQRHLATLPPGEIAEARALDCRRFAFSYTEAYGKTWIDRVLIIIAEQPADARSSTVTVRCERITHGMFTSSSKRHPVREAEIQRELSFLNRK